MKTQNRASATAKNSLAVGPTGGDRLPVAPRERKPALAALAALLVLVGALGTTVLVMQAGDRIEAIRITKPVPIGQPIPDDAMTPVLVADGSDINYVPWSQREKVQKELRPRTDLVDGSVLVGEMLTAEETLGANKVIVGVSLQPGQYPSGLAAGDSVAAYFVGQDRSGEDTEGQGPEPVIAERARVESIHGERGSVGTTTLPVTLRIDRADAPALARAASGGNVSLVIVPAVGND